jgi:chromosome segregation ATPase
LQESAPVREFFMEVARAGDRLNQQDTEITALRKELSELKRDLDLAQRDNGYKQASLERDIAELRRARDYVTRQRDAILSAFHELRAHIGAIQTHCAAVVEAGSVAHRSAAEQARRLGLEPKETEVAVDEARLEAEMIGQTFGANARNDQPHSFPTRENQENHK